MRFMIPAAAERRHLFTLHYSFFILQSLAGCKFAALSNLRPPFLFLPAGEKETRRARCKGKRGAGVQTKMDPCFDKITLRYVASVCKFGANQNAPCFHFRCRSPGAHAARYFFTLHSYFREARPQGTTKKPSAAHRKNCTMQAFSARNIP